MAKTVGAVSIKLTARTNAFNKKMKVAGKTVGLFGKSVNRIASSFKGLLPLLTAGFGIAFVKRTLDSADALGKVGARLGIATAELAKLHHAANLSGIAVKTFDMGLQRMVRRVSEAAAGTGEAKDAIKELGLDAAILTTMSPDKAFKRIADAMMNVATQGDRVRLAMKLFDSEGVALIQTMQGGSAALNEMGAEAEKLGIALSEKAVKQAENFNDSMTRLKAAGSGLAIALAPAVQVIEAMAIGLTEVVAAVASLPDRFFGGGDVVAPVAASQPFRDALVRARANVAAQVAAKNVALNKALTAERKAQNKLQTEANKLLKSAQTHQERYNDAFDRALKLQRAGVLTAEEFNKVTEHMRRTILDAAKTKGGSIQFTRAMLAPSPEFGSANAARARFRGDVQERQQRELADAAKRTATNTQQTVQELERIEENTANLFGVGLLQMS